MRAALILVACALAAPAMGATVFQTWAARHGKTYSSNEESALREAIFNVNVAKINAHNAGSSGWKMAVNEFADLTSTEFAVGRIGGYVPRKLRRTRKVAPISGAAPPASVDWTTKGAVTPVKNQGQCGSCWSFSTTGSLEGATFIKTGTLYSLSEQQLVDCSTSYGNQGCNGGLMDDAFQYVVANGGLCSEASYPYTATGPNTCQKSCSVISESAIKGYTDVTADSDLALEQAIAVGPVSVAIEADKSVFQFYSSGILTGLCGTQLDHGVLAVGYGQEGTQYYWKVKNSWGASWGEAGYVRIVKPEGSSGADPYGMGKGECGILSDPSYPHF